MSAAATQKAEIFHVQHFELRELLDVDAIWETAKELGGDSIPTMTKLLVSLTAGNRAAADMLKQMLYWSNRGHRADGYIYKSHTDWFEEIALTRREIETARRDLLEIGLEWKLLPAGYNTVNHYRLKPEAFFAALARLLHATFEAVVASVQGYVQKRHTAGPEGQTAGPDDQAASRFSPDIQESSRETQGISHANTQNSKSKGEEEKAPQPQKTHGTNVSSGNGDAHAQAAAEKTIPPVPRHPPSDDLLTLYAENVEPMKPLLQKWIGEAVSAYGAERVRAGIEHAVAVGICKWAYIRAVIRNENPPEQRQQAQSSRRGRGSGAKEPKGFHEFSSRDWDAYFEAHPYVMR